MFQRRRIELKKRMETNENRKGKKGIDRRMGLCIAIVIPADHIERERSIG